MQKDNTSQTNDSYLNPIKMQKEHIKRLKEIAEKFSDSPELRYMDRKYIEKEEAILKELIQKYPEYNYSAQEDSTTEES